MPDKLVKLKGAMVTDLENKIAVITGGGGLLGVKHAEALLEANVKVLLLDINAEALNLAKTNLNSVNCETLICDITSEEAVKTALSFAVQKWGRAPHILINNAAIDPKVKKNDDGKNLSRLENFSLEQWNLEINVGLTGSLICSKIFGSEMAKLKSGVILNIASDLGIIAPDQRLYRKEGVAEDQQNVKPVTYSVIKHGLIGLTKYLATYWGPVGVRCNAFAPGGVYNNHPEEFVAKISQLIPMGRMAKIGEYKESILFLCSDASSYMNGAVLTADGGRSAW